MLPQLVLGRSHSWGQGSLLINTSESIRSASRVAPDKIGSWQDGLP